MSIMMSGIFQFPNDSKEHKLVKATTFRPGDSRSEVNFVVNNENGKPDLIEQANSPSTVLCMDAFGSERFSGRSSLQIQSDIEDKDRDEENSNKKLEKAIEENYSSPDLNAKEIISCTINKEAEDEIDQVTGKVRSCLMKTIVDLESPPDATVNRNFKKRQNSKHEYGETRVSHDGTLRVEKIVKLKIIMTVVNSSSISSNSSSRHSFCEERKSIIWEPANSSYDSGNSDASNEIETASKLPLPPRLREATFRTPLRLSSGRRVSTELPPPGSFEQLFSPKESPRRNSMPSALSKMVQLWRSSLDFIREYGKLEFPQHPCFPWTAMPMESQIAGLKED